MNDRSIAVMIDENDLEAVAALDPATMAAYVVERLAKDERRYPLVDADRWVSLGVSLHLARQQRVDLAATAWLRERPTSERLDLVCLLLSGLWRSGRAAPAVHPAALREVVAARAQVDPSPGTYLIALDYAVAATQDDGDETAALARTARAAAG